MWTYDKALLVVRAFVDAVTDGRAVVLEDHVLDRPYGWVFFYQHRAYLESGNPLDMFGGNAPVIFNRVSGEYRVTGTALPVERYLEEYEETLPSAQLQLKPQLRNQQRARTPDPGQIFRRQLVVFVDVDDTLVRSFGTKRIPITAVVQRVRDLHASGACLHCWSTGGADYARTAAMELGIAECFLSFLTKPQLMIDDQPPSEWSNLCCLHPNEVSSMSVDEIRSATCEETG